MVDNHSNVMALEGGDRAFLRLTRKDKKKAHLFFFKENLDTNVEANSYHSFLLVHALNNNNNSLVFQSY